MTPMCQALDLILGLSSDQNKQIQTLLECKVWLCTILKLFFPDMFLTVWFIRKNTSLVDKRGEKREGGVLVLSLISYDFGKAMQYS